MNGTLKTVLLTLLTLSTLTIAVIELMGISQNAIFNKRNKEAHTTADHRQDVSGQNEALPNASKPTVAKTTVSFDKDMHDFGSLKDGDVVEHIYNFKNTGKYPLIIDEVIAACGCTVPSYTKTPVAPGASGKIAISFNSKGRVGNVEKSIMVKSNAQEESIPLRFKAIVKE